MKKPRKLRQIAVAGAPAVSIALSISTMSFGAPSAPTTRPAAIDLPSPMTTSPTPYSHDRLVAAPYRPEMPNAVVPHAPHILAGDGKRPLRATPAIDVPPLAPADSRLPADASLPAGPAIRVASPDLSKLPVGTIAEKPDTASATVRSDPTVDLTQAGALILTPPPRTASPPAQLLTIPDPSHQIGLLPTPAPSAEDAPVAHIDQPGPTTLPATDNLPPH